MRVLIDVTYARRAPRSGTATYVTQITAALQRLEDVELVAVANERRRPPGGGGRASVANLLHDLRWTERELPRLARRHRADLIHHPLPAIAHLTGMPQVVTVHDLAFVRLPEAFAAGWRRWAGLTHRDAARRADAVIAVSETTAADVRELWGVDGSHLVVARHGPGQPLPRPSRSRPQRPAHFLYVGDDEPRKDLATLRAAHVRYCSAVTDPLPLRIAGPASGDPAPTTPEQLAELLADAAALVHPARYEGFGLTLVEAMAAGTPVIAARAPAATEICAGAARFVPPRDAVALAAALAELADGSTTRRTLTDAGIARAAAFSWKEAARLHRDAYSLALGARDTAI